MERIIERNLKALMETGGALMTSRSASIAPHTARLDALLPGQAGISADSTPIS